MFRKLNDSISASPQITLDDVAAAAAQGFTAIVNNRPEGESDDQVAGADIEQAAHAHGLSYVAIPVTHAGFSEPQVDAMAQVLGGANVRVLAYCRSGTRSTLLWALAEASRGADLHALSEQAKAAGYDLAPIATLMTMMAQRAVK